MQLAYEDRTATLSPSQCDELMHLAIALGEGRLALAGVDYDEVMGALDLIADVAEEISLQFGLAE